MKCSYGKISSPLTEIPVGRTEISVTEPARPLIWTYQSFYKGFRGKVRSRKPGSYEEAPSGCFVFRGRWIHLGIYCYLMDFPLKRKHIEKGMQFRFHQVSAAECCVRPQGYWKALDNIDVNLVSHRYVSGVLKFPLAPRFWSIAARIVSAIKRSIYRPFQFILLKSCSIHNVVLCTCKFTHN